MFEGKRFLPETGMPMRKIAWTSRLLALADPVPFTLASLIAKSLTRVRGRVSVGQRHDGSPLPPKPTATGMKFLEPAYGIARSNSSMSQAAVGQRSAHRPQWTQTFSSFTMTRPVWGSGAET